jgi:hypothetical protein
LSAFEYSLEGQLSKRERESVEAEWRSRHGSENGSTDPESEFDADAAQRAV